MTAAPAAAGRRLIKEETGTLIWSEPLPTGGRAVVKMYRHRPPHDPLRRLFLPYRAEREYRLLERLHRQGVACPEPLRWWHGRDRVHGRHESLVTRELENAVPLVDLLDAHTGSLPDLAPLFALGRRMHEGGVMHGAFYPRNVLVTAAAGSGPAYHVMDLAHGRTFRGGIVGRLPADYDLLDMLCQIAQQAPIAGAAAWLSGYGLDPGAAASLLERLPRHRIRRPWRHFRRIATDALVIMDRLRLTA
jgi:hypothetical protein